MKPGVSGFGELNMCHPHITCLPRHLPWAHASAKPYTTWEPPPPALSHFLTLSNSLSLNKPWRSSHLCPFTIEATPYLAGASPEDRRRTTPASCTISISSPWSFSNKLLPHLHPLLQAPSKRTSSSFTKPSPPSSRP